MADSNSPQRQDDHEEEAAYLTLTQLVRRTTLSKSTLTRLFRQKKIQGFQLGGPRTRIIFPHDAIEQAIQGGMLVTSQPHQPARLSGPSPRWKKTK